MSLVGSFAYQKYDHTAKTTGPGPQGSALDPATLSEGTGPSSTFTPSPGSDSEQSPDNKNRTFPSGDEKVEHLQRVQSNDDIEDHRREKVVLALARKYTNQSTTSTYTENPFDAKEDSVLNPHSPNFKARAWTKSLLTCKPASRRNGNHALRDSPFGIYMCMASGRRQITRKRSPMSGWELLEWSAKYSAWGSAVGSISCNIWRA